MKRKTAMTSLDVLALKHEMDVLSGSYLDKAFGGDPFSVRFNTEQGKKELVVYSGTFAFMTDPLEKEEGGAIGNLAATVRKKLDNSRVKEISQRGFDRIVVITFSRPEGAALVFELMGKGNVILTDGGRILAALRYEKRKGHEVVPGSEYTMPQLRFDIQSAGAEELKKVCSGSRGDIVRTLATVAGLGGDMAEETCTRSSIEFGRNPATLTDDEWSLLHSTAREIIAEAETKPDPAVYYSEGNAMQFAPLRFRVFSGMESKGFMRLSDCIVEFLRNAPAETASPESERASRLLERQKEAIESFRREMVATREFADSIYSNYSGFQSALQAMRAGRDAGVPYRKNADGTCTLSASGVEISINPSDDINRVASSIYDLSKELQRKVRRAEEALGEMETRKVEPVRGEVVPAIRKSRKRFWFDSFRWFVSSEGCLVIAGRDARTNDSLVAKHMGDGDRYAHADVYGAPSVVVKWQDGAGEKTLEEACSFALCFSRAWNAQIGAAPAYWVMPDQVSKTPQTGEYLPRGAFVIRGKRNYFSKLKLELAIGIITMSGEERLVCAPVSAVAAHAESYYLLVPGDRTKEAIAAQLSKSLGTGRDEIVSVLPPGRSAYSEHRGKEQVS